MMNRRSKLLSYVVVLIATAVAAPLQAQNHFSGAADIGLTNGEGRGGEYDARKLQGIRLAASARLASERFGMFVEVARESLGSLVGGNELVCRPAVTGGCVPGYPKMHGWSTSVGMLVRPRQFFEGRVGAGPGWYFTRDQANPQLTAIVGSADIAVYPTSHIGVSLAIQQVALARYRGDRLSVRPFTIGVRVR
jgi:hypothetical protein